MKYKKIIGNTVGTTIPKPDLRQTDPSKGDYVRGKEILQEQVGITPHIGDNGNWFIGDVDTGKPSCGFEYKIGHGLRVKEDGVTLTVDTADVVETDNTLPVTSAAVSTIVGNINALLNTI